MRRLGAVRLLTPSRRAPFVQGKEACATFETDVALCRATVLCAKRGEAFMKCAGEAVAKDSVTTGRECDKEAAAMKRCVRGFRLPKA